MIYKYLNGSKGRIKGGSYGGGNSGASGGTAKPYDLSALADPFFIGYEYFQTNKGVNKQLQGMKDMLHSLPAPSLTPEVHTPAPNYNLIDQQYIDAESKLNNTPILGTSINQHIAQQQAIGEKVAEVDHQRIQTLANMQNSALEQAAKDEFQNGLKRHQDAEERRKFDMAIKQQIQDNEDTATAIKTDAAKKVGQEFYTLHKLKRERENQKKLAAMRRDYYKDKQQELTDAEDRYDAEITQEFRDQFDKDWNGGIQDEEEFQTKYGIDREEYRDRHSEVYDSDAYKTAFDSFKAKRNDDWVKERNRILAAFDETWWNDNEDPYFKIIAKKGGTVPSRKTNRLSKNDRIAIDNNKELHNFVKQMNEKQAKIFLKLMSI